MKNSLLLLFLVCLVSLATAQDRFSVGDRVEASYAGSWHRAVITGGYETNEFGSTYEVKYDGSSGTMRLNANYVRPLFRANEKQTFKAGDRVEFKRWDDSVHEGDITGVDGQRYQIRFLLNGYTSTEWVDEILVRPSAKQVAAQPATIKENSTIQERAVPFPKAAGQQFKIGDRVMYDELGFLVAKGYGTVIAYDEEKRLYTVQNEKDASLRYSYACYNVHAPDQKFNTDFFVGSWDVYISGAMTTRVDKDKVITTYSGGMKLRQLDIRGDGTYRWRVDDKKVINGTWKPRQDLPGITILKGIDGLDWTVYETTEAFATSGSTRDEIRFHHLPTSTGYYLAYRIGPNKSCILAGRKF